MPHKERDRTTQCLREALLDFLKDSLGPVEDEAELGEGDGHETSVGSWQWAAWREWVRILGDQEDTNGFHAFAHQQSLLGLDLRVKGRWKQFCEWF